MFLDTVGAILGLPTTCMKSFGHINCLLSSNVVNVEASDSSFQVDTEGASASLIVPKVHLGSLPFLLHFFEVSNHKKILFLFFFLGPAQRHSGVTYCSQDASFGLL